MSILLDFNNFTSITYSRVATTLFEDEKKIYKRTKVVDLPKEKTSKLKTAFLNYVLGEFQNIKNRYQSNYGELVLVSDYRKDIYWRKLFYEDYKINRDKKSNDFDKAVNGYMHDCKNSLLEISKKLGIKILSEITTTIDNKLVSVEADEAIAILSTLPGKHIIVSNDGDYQQLLLNDNVKIHSPSHNKIVDKSKKDISRKINEDLIKGQAKDSIPAISFKSHLDKDFISFLKSKYDVDVTDTVENVKLFKNKFKDKVQEYEKIEYDKQTQAIQEGKRKKRTTKSAFEKSGMGDVTVKKILDKHKSIEEYLKEINNEIYYDNYELNKILYLLDKKHIPIEVQEAILSKFEELESRNINGNGELIRISMEYGLDSSKLVDF